MSRAMRTAVLCAALVGWASAAPVDPVPESRLGGVGTGVGTDGKDPLWKPNAKWCPPKKVCANDVQPLGCFEQGPTTPWCHMAFAPQGLDKVQPTFWLYKPHTKTPIRLDFTKDLDLDGLGEIDVTMEFFTISHGFGGPYPQEWVPPMARALNDLGHYALTIDWTGGSDMLNYLQAAANTRMAGAALAQVVNELIRRKGVEPALMTMVGFSLGAHVSGFAGARVKGLKRIIGLDPAGPLYAKNDPFQLGMNSVARLNSSDAQLVVCIHTDGLNLLPSGGAGTSEAFGHMDFYPNGGQIQPGCAAPLPVTPMRKALEDLVRFDWKSVMNDFTCPHSRAPAYMTTAIRNFGKKCHFGAFPCRNAQDWLDGKCLECGAEGCPTAGLETDLGAPQRGKFFFNTMARRMDNGGWCGRQYQLNFTTDYEIYGRVTFEFGGSQWTSPPTTFVLDGGAMNQQRLVTLDFAEVPQVVKVTYAPEIWSVWRFRFTNLQINRLGDANEQYSVPAPILGDSAHELAIWRPTVIFYL